MSTDNLTDEERIHIILQEKVSKLTGLDCLCPVCEKERAEEEAEILRRQREINHV